MFNLDAFDVAIGMILIYLLLSLIVSAANEVIAQFLRWRARDLEKVLVSILEDPDFGKDWTTAGTSLVKEFYSHGLVQSLTNPQSIWERLGWGWKSPSPAKGKDPAYLRPSYIPNSTFVRVLLEVIPKYVGKIADADDAVMQAHIKKIEDDPVAQAASTAADAKAAEVATAVREAEAIKTVAATTVVASKEATTATALDAAHKAAEADAAMKAYADAKSLADAKIAEANRAVNPIKAAKEAKEKAKEFAKDFLNGDVTGDVGSKSSNPSQTPPSLVDLADSIKGVKEAPDDLKKALLGIIDSGAVSTQELEKLKAMIGKLKPFVDAKLMPQSLYDSLLSLVSDKTVTNMNEGLKNIENWFDDVMDKASSLYQIKVKHMLLALGLVVCVIMNADSIMLAKALWNDAPLRASLVAAAEQTTKVDLPDSKDGKKLIDDIVAETKKLQIPLGWNQRPEDPKDSTRFPPLLGDFSANFGEWFLKILGLLVTTFALSYGAPFWFDLLNKFVKVRGVLKPETKSTSTATSSSTSTTST